MRATDYREIASLDVARSIAAPKTEEVEFRKIFYSILQVLPNSEMLKKSDVFGQRSLEGTKKLHGFFLFRVKWDTN